MSEDLKGFIVVPDRTYGYFSVKRDGKGPIPKELKGLYTKSTLAIVDIKAWLDKSGKSKAEE